MGLTALIVDDSPLIRAVVAKCLRLSGLTVDVVHEAGDGCEALDLLAAEAVDLVFCDLHMPRLGGVEMIERLAAAGRLPELPVLIISSDRSRERREQLLGLGARDFLQKPFTPESVREAVLAVTEAPA